MASRSIARADPLGALRGALRLLALALVLFLCLIPHGAWRLARVASPWPRIFLASVARICGAVVEARGPQLGRDVFFVANHVSWFDIPVLAGATGTAFVAHDAIASWPIVGWLASLNNTVFVARADKLGVADQIETLRAALDANQPVAIFPEGTTSDGAGVLPFKPSLFAVVAPPPKPMRVQPLLIDYGPATGDIAWVGDEPAIDNAWGLLTRPGRFRVRIDFLAPFDPAAFPDRKAIAAEARRLILRAASASGRRDV